MSVVMKTAATDIETMLGEEAQSLLGHVCKGIPKESLHLPGPDYVDRVMAASDRKPGVLRAMQQLFDHGRLGGTGYLSILPVDQGIEHSAGASFAPNPACLRPGEHRQAGDRRRLQRGRLHARRARQRSRAGTPTRSRSSSRSTTTSSCRIPTLTIRSCSRRWTRRSRWARWRWARRSTSARRSRTRQIQEITEAFEHAHELGMATILWAYLQEQRVQAAGQGLPPGGGPDRAGQPPVGHDPGRHRQAEDGRERTAATTRSSSARPSPKVYSELTTDHPIDLVRYQVANCYMGRAGHDQLGRRVQGRRRPGAGGAHGGDQQARGRHGAHLRAQGVPEAVQGRHRSC
ncbi:MAG: hypothetical protein KatS3mg123_2348 [Burkholderiales bacterium]|nr:MAG: hypothetical protein KatS3mg123_2348 [Burkholderiales bacterium]